MKIVSSCLAGINCRRDGTAKPCQKVIDLVKDGKAIPICPEQLWWLSTPRMPAEKKDDRVFTKDWVDVTEQFQRWAEETLKIAQSFGCKSAILKSKSPSCWSGKVYDGSFSDRLITSDGVTAELLKCNGIDVITEDDI